MAVSVMSNPPVASAKKAAPSPSEALSHLAVRARTLSDADARLALSRDGELQAVARACRAELVSDIDAELGPFDPVQLQALLNVPRERFVRPEDIARSAEDTPLPLDDTGLSTISAPHAYLLSFRLLGLASGDSVLELGSGSGYGAALASEIVGPTGRVLTLEIDDTLAACARALLADRPNVTVWHADAVRDYPADLGIRKVVCTFAVGAVPSLWLASLQNDAVLVAPVGRPGAQRLLRITRVDGELRVADHGGVRYVPNRSVS